MKQQQQIVELRSILGDELPVNARADDLILHRFLVARDWVVQDSEEMLRAHFLWRAERFPIYRSVWKMDQMFLNGAIFPHGYDKEGRPVLVIRSGKFCPNVRNLENVIAAGVAQVIELFRRNGGFSKITVVYDRQDFSSKWCFCLHCVCAFLGEQLRNCSLAFLLDFADTVCFVCPILIFPP